MSAAGQAVQRALVAALRGHAPLAGKVSGVFDGPPAGAALPWVEVDGGFTSDWSTKDARGREHRLGVVVRAGGASAGEVHGLMAEAEVAIEGMARDLSGHRVASLVFMRGRVVRDGGAGPWAGLLEYRARTLEV